MIAIRENRSFRSLLLLSDTEYTRNMAKTRIIITSGVIFRILSAVK